MTTTKIIALTDTTSARVDELAQIPKLYNIRITFSSQSFGEEGVFYPAQDVTISGEGIGRLRDLLNQLPAE